MIFTAKVINKLIEMLFPKIYEKVMDMLNELIEPLHKYVHEPNELDDKVEEFESRIKKLEDNKGCKCSESDNKKWYDK